MSWGLLHFGKGGYFMAGVNHFHSHSHGDHKPVKSCKRKEFRSLEIPSLLCQSLKIYRLHSFLHVLTGDV